MSLPVLNLDTLPSDVIQKIVRVGDESLDSMRLISHRWNRISLDHLTDRKRLPSIKWMTFRHGNHDTIVINMWCASKYRSYFGVDHWAKCIFEHPTTIKGQAVVAGNTNMKLNDNLKRVFSRSSRVERLETRIHDQFRFYILPKYICNMNVEELAIHHLEAFNKHTGITIMKFIRALSVRCLTLAFGNFILNIVKTDIERYIVDASSVISTINLITGLHNHMSESKVRAYWTEKIEELKPENFSATVDMESWKINKTARLVLQRI